MEEQFTLETIIRENLSLLGIKEVVSGVSLRKRIKKLNVRRYKKNFLFSRKISDPHIAIIGPLFLSHLRQAKSKFFLGTENPADQSVVLIICSGASEIDWFIRDYAQKRGIAAASSTLDEYCLLSRLTGLIREKIQKKTILQGVALEIDGRGVLITGASGIGKTTAALKAAYDGNYWIADDVVVVRKNAKEELIARGHHMIKNLVYTKETGIVSVQKVLDFPKIKKSAKLATVIEIETSDGRRNGAMETKKKILGKNLRCLRVNVQPGEYFSKDMLKTLS